ncbi:MAG TPA: hypothetical protein VLC98_11595 [Phnomibacter sp.]|nr:hypothetical protein [Phnomibacter sp.]
MRYKLFLIVFLICGLVGNAQDGSFYNIKLPCISKEAEQISMEAFKGKKVLVLVYNNVKPNPDDLVFLQKILAVSSTGRLAILICPVQKNLDSNQFLISGAKDVFESIKEPNLFVSSPLKVGDVQNLHPLLQMLWQKTSTSGLSEVKMNAFDKFLISEAGKVIGYFSKELPLSHPSIRTAIGE